MSRFIVVGGGIIGMLTAKALRQKKHQVILFEAGQLASESTWAGGGIISPLYPWRYPQPISSLASWSQQVYPELCAELQAQTGVDPEYTLSGLMITDLEEQSDAICWSASNHVDLTVIDPTEVNHIEPAYESETAGAIWLPQVAQLRNPRVGRALAKFIAAIGVEVHENEPIHRFIETAGRVVGAKTSISSYTADAVVVCAGAWSKQLLETTEAAPEIEPVKGQMLLFEGVQGRIKRMVLGQNRYVIPRRDGRVLFGSTVEHVGFDKGTSQEAFDELHQIAVSRLPCLADMPVTHHWSGLRPGTAQGIPYICEHPELKGLYLNAGHFRNGVVLGPASAQLCVDLVLDDKPIIDLAAFGWEQSH